MGLSLVGVLRIGAGFHAAAADLGVYAGAMGAALLAASGSANWPSNEPPSGVDHRARARFSARNNPIRARLVTKPIRFRLIARPSVMLCNPG